MNSLDEIDQLAERVGTRFVRKCTKHPLAWSSAVWLCLLLKEHGYHTKTVPTGGGRHFVHVIDEVVS